MGRFSTDSSDAGAPPDTSLELLGIEPLEDHARRLAALLTVRTSRREIDRAHLKRLDAHMRALRQVYIALADDARRGEQRVARRRVAARQLPHHLGRRARHPPRPAAVVLSAPAQRRRRRVRRARRASTRMALELIGRSAGRLDAQRLQRFVTAFQSVTPLTIGELWAWPSALKLALIDTCAARADVAGGEPRAPRARRSARRRARDHASTARRLARRRSTRRSSSACCSARASTGRAPAHCASSSMRALARRGRDARGRDPRGGTRTRRPSRRRWRT